MQRNKHVVGRRTCEKAAVQAKGEKHSQTRAGGVFITILHFPTPQHIPSEDGARNSTIHSRTNIRSIPSRHTKV